MHLTELNQRISIKNALMQSTPNIASQNLNNYQTLNSSSFAAPMHKDDLGDSDEEELKHEKPILNAE